MDLTRKTFTCDAAVCHSCAAKHQYEGKVGHRDTQSAIVPKDICHISDIFCDKVSTFVLPNIVFQKAQWETKAKIQLIRSVLDSLSAH